MERRTDDLRLAGTVTVVGQGACDFVIRFESVVLGREATGEKQDQIAMLTGVNREWLDGFCDSLRGANTGADGSYRDGFCLARWPELRRWIVPLANLPKATT